MIQALIRDALRAFGQLRHGPILLLVAVSALIAFAILAGLTTLTGYVLGQASLTGYGWADTTLQWAGTAAASIMSWFLYPILITALLGLFSDQICDAVETISYPHLPPAKGLPFAASLAESLSFLGYALFLNILVLPLYLLPGPNLMIYLALNGWLLGREYFGTAGFRRRSRQSMRELRRGLRFEIWLAGTLIAGLMLVPLLNLLVPVLGLTMMIHQYWRYQN